MEILGFEYPDDAYFLLEEDMWCRPGEDGALTVGVTAFGIHLSDDFYMCRPKRAGTGLAQGDPVAVAELSKSVVAIRSPVSGRIVEANALLADAPELVHREPYGRGWLVRIAPSRWDEDRGRLAHGASLREAAIARMRAADAD